jgi:hypothetical protein
VIVPVSLIFFSVPESAATFADSWAFADAARIRIDAAEKIILAQPRPPGASEICLLAYLARMTRIKPP